VEGQRTIHRVNCAVMAACLPPSYTLHAVDTKLTTIQSLYAVITEWLIHASMALRRRAAEQKSTTTRLKRAAME